MTSEEPLPDRCGAKCRDGGYCTQYPVEGRDRCRIHPGTNADGSSHEGNQNAVVHGAYAESFMDGFLTEAEQDRVREAADHLSDEASAREHGQFAAAICMEQFRRSGDERFLRRYESICDKFGITPADEVELSGDLDVSTDLVVDFEETDT